MTFYVGDEFHLTPAHKQRTLFVEGLHDYEEILMHALNEQCPHIHMGHNDSFNPNGNVEWTRWEKTIIPMLENKVWVTLSFDNKYGEDFLEAGMTEYDTFIPLIKLELPYVNQYNYNTTVALTDKQKQVNPGVWYHDLHSMLDRDSFVHKTKYTAPLKVLDNTK